MCQDRKFSAAAKNSGLPGKFHWSLYGIYFGEREGRIFFFYFFLLGSLGFALGLVPRRIGRTALQRALKFFCYPLCACLQLRS